MNKKPTPMQQLFDEIKKYQVSNGNIPESVQKLYIEKEKLHIEDVNRERIKRDLKAQADTVKGYARLLKDKDKIIESQSRLIDAQKVEMMDKIKELEELHQQGCDIIDAQEKELTELKEGVQEVLNDTELENNLCLYYVLSTDHYERLKQLLIH